MRTYVATAALCVAAVQAMSAQEWEPRRRARHRDGVQIRVGRDYTLPADQIATWPIIIIGGSATIDGRVEDDLVVIGGAVRIGPAAQVRADVVAVGGEVQVADTAEVSGEIHEVSMMWPDIRFAMGEWLWGLDRGWWAAFSLAGTMFRFALVMLAACALALVAPGWIRRVEERVAGAAIAAGFVGLATEMLFVPALLAIVIGLVLTIVGIPLLVLVPFAVLAFLVGWLAGFAGVAAQLGARLRGRAGSGSDTGLVIDVASGVALLFVLPFIGNLFAFGPSLLRPLSTSFGLAGFVIEYLAWTVGLGAMILALFSRRWPATPPPVPSAASASA
ncbi:MAG: hypothetical protein ACRD26_09500 [Vicinamibacterales bacterium]